jgi:hypothetical protein
METDHLGIDRMIMLKCLRYRMGWCELDQYISGQEQVVAAVNNETSDCMKCWELLG